MRTRIRNAEDLKRNRASSPYASPLPPPPQNDASVNPFSRRQTMRNATQWLGERTPLSAAVTF